MEIQISVILIDVSIMEVAISLMEKGTFHNGIRNLSSGTRHLC